jgi:hypothetical protein
MGPGGGKREDCVIGEAGRKRQRPRRKEDYTFWPTPTAERGGERRQGVLTIKHVAQVSLAAVAADFYLRRGKMGRNGEKG